MRVSDTQLCDKRDGAHDCVVVWAAILEDSSFI
jgi:hypothetical protein